MQIFLTVISGVVLFLFGQISLVFFLEPIKNFNRQRGDMIYYLYRFRNVIENKALSLNESDIEYVGDMGAAVAGATSEISFYDAISRINVFALPKKADVFSAAEKYTSLAIKYKKKALTAEDYPYIEQTASLLGVELYPLAVTRSEASVVA